MAIKLVKKSKLEFENGYFFHKGKIVAIDPGVVEQINHLELVYQQYKHIHDQPEATPEPSMYDFKFESTQDKPVLGSLTPLLDTKIAEAKQIMDELDSMEKVRATNEAYERYDVLIQWAKNKKAFVSEPDHKPQQVDTKYLGNPLEWGKNFVPNILAYMATGVMPVEFEDFKKMVESLKAEEENEDD